MSPRQIAIALRKARISMAEVARRHGCNTSVVSRALRDLGTSYPVLETAKLMLAEKKEKSK